MPSTHLSLYVHFIFSTKERRCWIKESWEERLHACIGGIMRNMGAVADTVGGDADHVHVLASLLARHCVMNVMRDVKSNSSGWVHRALGIYGFEWQDGYGAFTVGRSDLDSVREYIRNQKEHHKKKTFQEEFLELLQESGIEFDEKFLW
jgi:putative transposase